VPSEIITGRPGNSSLPLFKSSWFLIRSLNKWLSYASALLACSRFLLLRSRL
jgi:hypothetical protein